MTGTEFVILVMALTIGLLAGFIFGLAGAVKAENDREKRRIQNGYWERDGVIYKIRRADAA